MHLQDGRIKTALRSSTSRSSIQLESWGLGRLMLSAAPVASGAPGQWAEERAKRHQRDREPALGVVVVARVQSMHAFSSEEGARMLRTCAYTTTPTSGSPSFWSHLALFSIHCPGAPDATGVAGNVRRHRPQLSTWMEPRDVDDLDAVFIPLSCECTLY